MKKPLVIILSVIAALVLFTGCTAVGSYNGLVNSQSDVEQAQSKIQTAEQRRYDLIPNVVNATKGYMKHEQEVFKSIADARSKIGSGNKAEAIEGQTELDSAISRLLVLTESYPELKADQQVNKLIVELEGSENRLFTARNDYNTVATKYNKKIRRFPSSIWANLFGFDKVDLYESDPGADKAPTVNLE